MLGAVELAAAEERAVGDARHLVVNPTPDGCGGNALDSDAYEEADRGVC